MNLSKYLQTFNKDKCPANCNFKNNKNIDIISIPPPDLITGIIISRDPTIDWLYSLLKSNRDVLFASAIPLTLLTKILIFMRNKIDIDTEKALFNTIFYKTYWTHLHKCQTDVTNKVSLPFNVKNANRCADQWLENELSYAITDNTKFIIPLGNEAQKWIEKWNKAKEQGITIINLPHPSGNNNPIWYRSQNISQDKIDSTEEQILQLIDLVNC